MLTKRETFPARLAGVPAWSFLCAGVLVAQIFALASVPYELFEPWDKLFHALAYSALTLLLWIGTDGRRPALVVVGVMALAMFDELRQAAIPARSADLFDFLVGAIAAGATGLVLSKNRGRTSCAESSAR